MRCDSYPNLLRWYEAMDERPSYRGIKSDYYTHCHDLPPQVNNHNYNYNTHTRTHTLTTLPTFTLIPLFLY